MIRAALILARLRDAGAGLSRAACRGAWAAALTPFLKFIVGVIFYVEATQIAWGRGISIESETAAKACLSQPATPVEIFNGADQKQSSLSVQNIENILIIKNCSIANLPSERDARSNRSIGLETSYSHVWPKGHFVVRRALWQAMADRNNYGYVINPGDESFSITNIDNIEVDFQRPIKSPSSIVGEPHMFQAHSWPMGGKKFASSELQLISTSEKQADSGTPQTYRSDGENGSEKREPPVIARDSLFGAFLLGLGIGSIIFFGLCAVFYRGIAR